MEIRRLNSLRGLAALIVLVSHFSNDAGAWGKLPGEGAGQFGVMLFFMLSGFLMAHLYWDKQQTGANLFGYFVSRFARVIPLYIFVVFASFLTPYFYGIEDLNGLASHLLFLHGNAVLWTIPPEIQFYVLFGMAWYFLKKRPDVLISLMALAFIGGFFLDFRTGSKVVFGLTVTPSIIKSLPYFMVGCLLGLAYNWRRDLSLPQRHWYLLSLILIPLLYPNIFHLLFGFDHGIWQDVGVLAVMSLVFISVVFLVPDGNPLLENRFGDFLGKVSYSLYLLHLPVLALVLHWRPSSNNLVLFALFLVLALGVSWLSFQVLENPSRVALRKLLTRRGVVAGMQSAVGAGRN